MSEAIPSETDINTDPKSDNDENENENENENGVEDIRKSIQEAQYFDPSSMAALTPASMAAIARLRAYNPPPFSVWDRLPLSRRAAVLVLLFADRRGDLRVVLTMRAATLRNFSGQAAFPGGKADSLEETPWETARREAFEEIGLPLDDSKIPAPFRIEHLCQLPNSLAKTALAVRPCVAFLHSDDVKAASVGDSMIPRLDAKEVAAVFSAPFHNFLKPEDEVRDGDKVPGQVTDWYDGRWVDWHDGKWRLHNFHVPINNQKVSKPKVRQGGQAAIAEELDREEDEGLARYKVWGMTARMIVDAARVAYGEEPTFPCNDHFGDEPIIEMLEKMGKLGEKVPGGPDLTEPNSETAKAAEAAKVSASKM
ncbi:Peroxisomal coenzyme A diphosphatase, peroxisomal [Lachnellula hyalina]|uniref:Peroxisomal coenzyme A diphosphatase, peroxisomal n=1 Tax=Lachnellula hyalina TaxID=1316788 RepID=A0A8H8TZP9_9HELO|nr:Peroxisomal coenzyme A diphosphatase, peroxisomal [Lachnellula hyalina]TVY28062.1 Peroxisomal coenzyme A diphosphatase, peroxisomal [Lachnellula hyalina]